MINIDTIYMFYVSLAPGWLEWNFSNKVIFMLILVIDAFVEIALKVIATRPH